MILLPRRRAHRFPREWATIKRWSRGPGAHDVSPLQAWEEAVIRFTGVPFAASVNSGRLGMSFILRHLGLGPGDEVIIPAYTLKDLAPLIAATGASVTPADIDEHTLNVTAASVAQRISRRTRAVIVLHAFGAPAPMPELIALATERKLTLIEDGAHALGAAFNGRAVGGFGYAAFYSFEPTKPVNTYGGGMVVSRDESLIRFIHQTEANKPFHYSTMLKKADAVRKECLLMQSGAAWPLLLMLSHPRWGPPLGAAYRKRQQVPSGAARYNPCQARLGIEKLGSLPERLACRRDSAARLTSRLRPEIRVQRVIEGSEPTWYFFVAILPEPAAPVRRRLLWHGVDAAVGNEIADDCAALLGYDDCPAVRFVFDRAIALPIYDVMTEREIDRVAERLNRALS